MNSGRPAISPDEPLEATRGKRGEVLPASRPAPGFKTDPLRDMVAVGAVTSGTARLWVRSEHPGRVRVAYWPQADPSAEAHAEMEIAAGPETAEGSGTDRTACITLPADPGSAPLRPCTAYAYTVVHASAGDVLGEGTFETSPRDAESAPSRFSIALMSCNQPFDGKGGAAAAGANMLRAARKCLERHATKLVLTVGDQMYTDYPPSLSLFDPDYFRSVAPSIGCESVKDCTAAQVRGLLQQRHRYFWNFEGWRALHARYPCYPILDDHELVDNWGSDPAHATPAWRDFIDGARAAYFDYQGSRVTERGEVGEDFDYGIEYGPAAAYVMDLRSNRKGGAGSRIYSAHQLEEFSAFLRRQADKEVLFIVLSVPAVHLPRWGARVGRTLTRGKNEDFSDRWSTAGHVRDRDRLLRLLHDHQQGHPDQRIVLLSGDIHIACVHEIAWKDGTRPLTQFVSSGITNKAGRLTQAAAKLSILANRKLVLADGDGLEADVRLVRGATPRSRNPFTKLNVGLVELERARDGRFAMRFLVYGHRGSRPVCVYRSRWR